MITISYFCNEINHIIQKIDPIYLGIFKHIVSIFYLYNNNILRIDYKPYFTAKIKKSLASIKKSYTGLNKVIKLEYLCKQIYDHSLKCLDGIVEIRNIPKYRIDGSLVSTSDIFDTFKQIGKIKLVRQVGAEAYIIKFKDPKNNKLIIDLVDNKLIENNLVRLKFII